MIESTQGGDSIMKQYDSNVSAVMMYLQEHNYSNSVTWSHLKCYQCLKEYLMETNQSYSYDLAIGWVDAHSDEWNYRQICGYKHCINQLNDIYEDGVISQNHVAYQFSAYTNLIPSFRDALDRFLNGYAFNNERYRIACSRFLMYLQINSITDLEDLNYETIIEFHNNDHHRSYKSKDVYEDLIREFLRYLARLNVCDIGLSLALNKMLIDKILIINDAAFFEDGDDEYPRYPTLEWDIICQFISEMERTRYGETVIKSSRHILTLLYIFFDMNKSPLSDKLVWKWFELIRPKLGTCWKQHRRTLCQFLHYLKYGEITTAITGNPEGVKAMDLLPEWIKTPLTDYLELLKREGWCQSTIAMQKSSNMRFCNYLIQRDLISFDEVTPEIIKEFNLRDKHSTPEGKAAYNCRIRGFLIYLYEQNIVSEPYLYRALPTIASSRKTIVETLTTEELEQIWSVDVEKLNPKAMRDYAMLIIGLTMGFRASDISALRFENIDWKECSISIVQQKTGKILKLPMPVKTGNILYRYIRYARPVSNDSYIFIRHEAPYDRIQCGVCRSTLRRFLGLQASDKCKFHSVRKTFATELLSGNTKLELITESLGHRTDTTVHKYLSLDEVRMKACALSLKEAHISYKGGAFYA